MNLRPLLMIFLGAILGVVFSLFVIKHNLVAFIIFLVIISFLLLFYVLSGIFSKSNKFTFANKFILTFLIGFFIFFGLSTLNFKIFNNNIIERENVEISCRVSSCSEQNRGYYLILENCVLNNSEKVNGKIGFSLYCNDEMPEINVGDSLKFKANLVVADILKDGKFNSYYYKNNLKYFCYASEDVVETSKGTLKFDEKCREKVKQILFDNLTYNSAAISFASIFGDKTLLDDNILDGFSVSGTSHLLCVSGLHIGFLATLIYFILNLCKVKKKYSFIILTIILCLYSYICSFSPSVVRASIMSIVFAFADMSGKVRYDSLSALSFAGILILIFKPFYVFDVGFQLSFSACAGIILLSPIFTKLFKKIGFDNKISSTFVVTLSAQLGTFPILFHNFKSLSFLSVIANVLIVPLFSLIFMFTIVFVVLNLILPFGFLFKITQFGMDSIIALTKGFGAVSECVFETFSVPLIYNLLFYFGLICVSGIVNLKIKVKAIIVLMCVVCAGLGYAFQFYPQVFKTNYLINSQCESFTIITNSRNEKVLINCEKFNENDVKTLKNDTFDNKIFDIDIFIVAYYNEEMQSQVCDICSFYGVKNLYLSSNISETKVKNLFKNLGKTNLYLVSSDYQNYSNFTFKLNGNIKSVEFNVMDKELNFSMFLCGSLNDKSSKYIIDYNVNADLFKTKIVDSKFSYALSEFDNILCYQTNYKKDNVFNINKICDKIILGEKLAYAF